MKTDGFMPLKKQDMIDRGIAQMDFVYVCGDAYVDHSSFGMAIIGRILEAHGYTVGLICQPDWKTRRVSANTGNRDSDFWYLPAIWTPWSITIQSRESAEKQTPTVREAKPGGVRIML